MSESRDDDRERRLEALLDATLRAMVQGEGPADLRQRVMARLDRPQRRVLWLAWAAAAAVAAIILVWWGPPYGRIVPESRTVSREATPATTASPAASASPQPTTPISSAPDRPRTRKALPTDPADLAVPALPQPEPIAIAALRPPDIEIEPLSLDPLVVPHLAVEPLGEPEHERKD